MGWFVDWFNKVDIGARPRHVFDGTDVNLYPFTRLGAEWIERNHNKFKESMWSARDRCLMLSKDDSSYTGMLFVSKMIQDAGLQLKFYGRLSGWELARGVPQPQTQSAAAHSTLRGASSPIGAAGDDPDVVREFKSVFFNLTQAGRERLISHWMNRSRCSRTEAMRRAVDDWRRDQRSWR